MKRPDEAFVHAALASTLSLCLLACQDGESGNHDARMDPRANPTDVVSRAISVPNGTLEQADEQHPNLPRSWQHASWGVNQAAFDYPVAGRDASRAVGLTVASLESGDAKWYFEPQLVTPGARYLFSDSYQANVPSFVVARITLADGTYQNLPLSPAPPAEPFTALQRVFLAPAGAVRATVFHGLAAVGSLRIDDVALAAAPALRVVRGVANGDLEQEEYPGSQTPAGFHQNTWGHHDARFSYASEGHSGQHSVGIDMTSHADGTAAWYFDELLPGDQRALFYESFYRANVDTLPEGQARLRGGATVKVTLPPAFRSEQWTRYAHPLWLPDDTISFTVFHPLATPGFLRTDDYAVRPFQAAPFRRGIVSLTFDDGFRSDYETVLPLLEQHGAHGTFYVLTDRLQDSTRVSLEMLADLHARGHEVGAHTALHRALPTLSDAELEAELEAPRRLLESVSLGPVVSFASPYGAYDARTLARIPIYYRSHRTVDDGYNTKNDFDPLRLRVQSIMATTTAAQVGSWVARAAADRSWLILVYHEVSDASDGQHATTATSFAAQLSVLAASGLPFLTISQALAELLPQR